MKNQDDILLVEPLDFPPPPVMPMSYQEMEYRALQMMTEVSRIPLCMFYKRRDGIPLTQEKVIKGSFRRWSFRLRIVYLKWRGWMIVRVTTPAIKGYMLDKNVVTIWMVR